MLAVHDELIGECPKENADAVADRLCEVMKTAALPVVSVPFKCDPTIESNWYYTDYSDTLNEKYNDYISSGKTKEDAFNQIALDHIECTREQLIEMLHL